MIKVLGIIGSKRNLGNCETMVKEISRQITAPINSTCCDYLISICVIAMGVIDAW